jgi:phosphatidylserine decarboxylase
LVAKDGLGIIVSTFILFILSLGASYIFQHPSAYALAVIIGVLSIFNLFFFRDPKRDIPNNPLAVLSPADGKVTQIIKIDEPDYFDREVQRISIFLSVFNVHVNRMPIAGKVDYFSYRTGKFLAAFKEDASLQNEQTVIGVANEHGHKVLFKQIAGLIARRIICNLREGQEIGAGKRMGLIRYGSRVDVFLAPEAKILVKVGSMVRGGETILATFPNNGSVEGAEETLVETPKPQPETTS